MPTSRATRRHQDETPARTQPQRKRPRANDSDDSDAQASDSSAGEDPNDASDRESTPAPSEGSRPHRGSARGPTNATPDKQTSQTNPMAKRARHASPAGSATKSTPKRTKDDSLVKNTPAWRARIQAREALHNWCRLTYREVRYYKEGGGGRLVSKLFHDLPLREDYPDYYEVIARPLCLTAVREKIDNREYNRAEEFRQDMELVFDNAMLYNEKGSQVYSDAVLLRKLFHQALKNLPSPFEVTIDDRVAQFEETGVALDPPVSKNRMKPSSAAPSSRKFDTAISAPSSAKPKITGAQVKELMQAIEDADYDIAFDLLDKVTLDPHALYPTKQDDLEFTWSFLHAAGFFGRVKILPALMDHRIPVDIRDTLYQGTPLAWAAYGTHKRIARALVERYNADVNAENVHNQTPIDLVPDDEVAEWRLILSPDKMGIRLAANAQPSRAIRTPTKPPPAQRPQASPTVSGHHVTRAQLIPVMLQIHQHLVSVREKDEDGDDRQVAEMFLELPSATEYPDYFEVIDEPMSFDIIAQKIASDYQSFAQFQHDCRLVFKNAKFFNEQGSQIYEDAVTLEKIFETEKGKVLVQHQLEFLLHQPPTAGETVVQFTLNHVTYAPGDFIFYRQPNDLHLSVALIQSLVVKSTGKAYFKGVWFYRPEQTYHLPTRMFYPQELFFGASADMMPLDGAQGKCYVMPLQTYVTSIPRGFPPDRVFLCESRYNTKSKSFQAIKDWYKQLGVDPMPSVILDPRPAPLQLTKQPSSLAATTAMATPKKKPDMPTQSAPSSSARSSRLRNQIRKSYAEDDEDDGNESEGQGWGDAHTSSRSQMPVGAAAAPPGGQPMGMVPGMPNPYYPGYPMMAGMGGPAMGMMNPQAFNATMMMRPPMSALPLHMQQSMPAYSMGPNPNQYLLQQQQRQQMMMMAQMQQYQKMTGQGIPPGTLPFSPQPGMGSYPGAMAPTAPATVAQGITPPMPLQTQLMGQLNAAMSGAMSPTSGATSPSVPSAQMPRRRLTNDSQTGMTARVQTSTKDNPMVSPLSSPGLRSDMSGTLATTNGQEFAATLPLQPWQTRTLETQPPPSQTSLIYRVQIASSDRKFFLTLDLDSEAYSFHLHADAPSLMIKPVSYHVYRRSMANGQPEGGLPGMGPVFFTLSQNTKPLPATSYVDTAGKFHPPSAFPLGIPAATVTHPGKATANTMTPASHPSSTSTLSSTPTQGDVSNGPDVGSQASTDDAASSRLPAIPLQALPKALAVSTVFASPIYDIPLATGLNAIELWVSNFPPSNAPNTVHTTVAKLPATMLQPLQDATNRVRYEQRIKIFVTK
ncbi:hypothetical protein H4R35_003187 [Dimargaris xerosporica]|nr:hypothetical protein H4R35_003187 [Dimargaris xerosporica]